MARAMCHTGTYRGKKVRVVLRDGTLIIDHFHDRNDKFVFLREKGKILKKDIKSMSDYKERNHGPQKDGCSPGHH